MAFKVTMSKKYTATLCSKSSNDNTPKLRKDKNHDNTKLNVATISMTKLNFINSVPGQARTRMKWNGLRSKS